MEITIIKEIENPILHRSEIHFEMNFLNQGSPNRIDVRDKIAAMKTAEPALTFIKSMKTAFGIPKLTGTALIYMDEKVALELEPTYSRIRNMPKDQRDDAWKEVKAKKKGGK
jgi:small subunit ribosomal protein S24e